MKFAAAIIVALAMASLAESRGVDQQILSRKTVTSNTQTQSQTQGNRNIQQQLDIAQLRANDNEQRIVNDNNRKQTDIASDNSRKLNDLTEAIALLNLNAVNNNLENQLMGEDSVRNLNEDIAQRQQIRLALLNQKKERENLSRVNNLRISDPTQERDVNELRSLSGQEDNIRSLSGQEDNVRSLSGQEDNILIVNKPILRKPQPLIKEANSQYQYQIDSRYEEQTRTENPARVETEILTWQVPQSRYRENAQIRGKSNRQSISEETIVPVVVYRQNEDEKIRAIPISRSQSYSEFGSAEQNPKSSRYSYQKLYL